jgi:predicted phage tail protein
MDTEIQKFIVQGQGGGSKKNPGSSSSDTLQSFAHVRLVDAISEGPIEGLVGGEDGIFINKTPLRHIEEAAWQYRAGLPDDSPMIGVNTTEAYVNVGVDISHELGPMTRSVTGSNLDGIRILMQLGVLYKMNKKGALKTADSGWLIEIREAGKQWQEALRFHLRSEKTTSGVQFDHVIAAPGQGPWDIRVSAIYGKRDKIEQNIQWTGYSTITNGNFTHPHTAMVGLALSSEHVGQAQPTRHYKIRGRQVSVPNNYDPYTRQYSGVWDGGFKTAWTNNPAWVFYDMARSNIFGVGAMIPIEIVNKWKLYTIAQYCDQLVPTGYKDAAGNPTMEPRYTFNGVITDKKEAFSALRSITSTWRGMSFYSLNQLYTTIDMPQDPAHIYSPANVVDGVFEYSTSSIKARNSVVMVRFNDPDNFYEPAIEPYVDDELLRRFGWREKSLELTGCSSRSLAHRYGKWVAESEKRETETVQFTVGLDSIHALPGEVIAISDPRRAQVRMSGRIQDWNNKSQTLTLDAEIDKAITGAISVRLQLNDGTLQSFNGTVSADNRRQLILKGGPLQQLVQQDAVFMLTSAQVAPREFRIVSIDEQTDNKFKITALQYDRNKFAAVESNIQFEPLPVKLDTASLAPPTDLKVTATAYTDGGRIRNDLEFSWKPSESVSVREYRITADTPSASNITVGKTDRNSFTYSTYEAGAYRFRVQAVSVAGNASKAVEAEYVVEGIGSMAMGQVVDLVNAESLKGGNNVEFKGSTASISWRNMVSVSSDPTVPLVDADPGSYSHTVLEFYFGSTKVRTQIVKGNTFSYTLEMNRSDAKAAGLGDPQRRFSIKAYIVDWEGRSSKPASLSLVNSAPAAISPSIGVEESYLNIQWPRSSDGDTEGYLVYVTTDGSAVAGKPPTATVVDNSYRFKGVSRTNYFVSVVGYDAFGLNGLNYSNPISVRTQIDGADILPPDPPSGLTVTGQLNADTSLVDIVVSWAKAKEEDFDQFQVEVGENGVNQVLVSNENQITFSVGQGSGLQVRARTMDKNFNWSQWSGYVTYVAPSDSVAPATPATVEVTPGIGMIILKWSDVSDADLASYEIWYGKTNTALNAKTKATASSTSAQLVITDIKDSELRYFAVRAVDLGGNRGDWTPFVSGKATTISDQITKEIEESNWSQEFGFVRPYTGKALPTKNIGQTISWNSRHYTWDGGRYVSVARYDDLTFQSVKGQVTEAQIGKAVVTADKIADSSIDIPKLTAPLKNYIDSKGVTAAADAAAAKAAQLAAETASANAKTYQDETARIKTEVGVNAAEVSRLSGVVAAARDTAILVTGNERFQFQLTGWIASGGSLVNLAQYQRNNVNPVFVLDVRNNFTYGQEISFKRATSTSVKVNDTMYTIGPDRLRIYETKVGRFWRTDNSETVGMSTAFGNCDVQTVTSFETTTIRKNEMIEAGWWHGHGDFFSLILWPAGTL